MPAPHTIPPELHAHYRTVRKKPGSGCATWFIRLFILPHTIVGICLLFVMPTSVIWAAFGTDHEARLTDVRETRGAKNQIVYRASYAYDGPGGRREGVANVSRRTHTDFSNAIHYRREPPAIRVRTIGTPPLFYEQALDRGKGPWAQVGFVWLFGLFWNGVLSVFAYMIYYVPWRQWRLYRSGAPIAGTLISKRTGRGSKGSTTYHLRYGYRTPGGESHEREMHTTRAEYNAATPGAPVTVLYDRRKPRRSVVYEYGPYRCD